MKKLIFLGFILVFLVSINAQPKIGFSEESFDFGNIKQGDQVVHDFVIFNEGTEDLTIDKVRASCGCTAAAPDKDVLAPGDSAVISVQFNSEGRQGVQKKYVYVFSNDPKRNQTRLSFTTKILLPNELDAEKIEPPKLAVSTNEIDFGNIKEGDIIDTSINIINKGKSELIVEDIKTSCGCAVASLSSNRLVPGEVANLKVKFDSSGRNGDVTRTITLQTNDPKMNSLTILLHANVLEGEKS